MAKINKGDFTKISSTAFNAIQTNAGMLLNKFNPADPASPADADIITATTGGINVVCQAEYTDFGEDIDNVPSNTKELKQLSNWTCTMSTTALELSAEVIRFALGAADVDSNDSKIVPRRDLKDTDFANLWWVGETLDGGWVAVKLINALSTDGFSLQTTKDGKGQISLTITGHVSIAAQNVMPMEFYYSPAA